MASQPPSETQGSNLFWAIAMIILAIAIVASIGYLSLNKPETTTVEIQPPLPTATERPTATPAPIEVHVVGEVSHMVEGEGVRLSLPPGSRVEDAIEAAGGPTDNANLEAVDLAQQLQDGDRIEVPAKVSPTATPAPIEVHVVGEVNHMVEGEGIRLSMPPGSRVEDAIEAAGGPTDNANLEAVNLAQRLQDGDRIEVPAKVTVDDGEVGGASAANTEPVPSPTRNAPRIVNINEADLDELTTLPRIGETTAQRIIDYREANGPFATIEDLLNVEGIGEGTLDNLRDLITVE